MTLPSWAAVLGLLEDCAVPLVVLLALRSQPRNAALPRPSDAATIQWRCLRIKYSSRETWYVRRHSPPPKLVGANDGPKGCSYSGIAEKLRRGIPYMDF